MYYRGMRPIKEFKNRRNFRCSGHKALRIAAERQIKQEHFMLPRAMRAYWDDTNAALYGPCGCVSHWLQYCKIRTRESAFRKKIG